MKGCTRAGRNYSGFSMIELLMTFVVLGIAAAVAIPSFSVWLPNYRLNSATQDLYSAFQMAKMNAIRSGCNGVIVFNKTIGGTVYDYVVFVDSDSDLEYDTGEQIIIKKLLADYKDVSFDTSKGGGDGLTFQNNDNGLPVGAFRPNGLTISNSGAPLGGTTFFINTKGKTSKVVVSSAGRIRTE